MGDTREPLTRLVAVLCDIGKKPELRSSEGDSLEILQKLVGGYIEKAGSAPFAGSVVVDVYVDEDGHMKQLGPNRLVGIAGRSVVAYGPVVLVGADVADGSTVSLDSVEGLTDFALKLAKSFAMVDT